MADLTDEDFDDMHHAIGRKGIKRAFRNYYCTPVGSETAKRFEATGCWDLRTKINDGRDAIYSVNMTGIEQLRKWLGRRPCCGITIAPGGEAVNPDDRLMTLKEAAKLFLGDGKHSATLKAEIGRGKLVASKIGRSYWTTLAALREMEAKCRVESVVPSSGSTRSETPSPSSMADPVIAQGAALRKLDELKKHFGITSKVNTRPQRPKHRSSQTSSRPTAKSTSSTRSPGNTSNTI